MMSHEDWEDQDQDADQSAAKSDEFAKMLEESFKTPQKRLSIGDKVRGEILLVGKEQVFVSTGTMTDGIIPRTELIDKEGNLPYQKGDHLDLFVTSVKGGEIYLSPRPTAKNLADDIQDAFDMMLPVEGRVTEVCKGGVRVSIMGKSAFCPISQLDQQRIESAEEYVGKRFEFKITQLSEGGRNIVVSRRRLLDEQRDLAEGSFLSEHRAGDVVQGKIKRLEKFGAFVEIAPGLEGLAHISELSWSRVNDPSEVVSVGKEVPVKILKIENAEGSKTRISLSIKQAGEQPWENLPGDVRVGQVVEGRVTRCAKFGAFVELSLGVEGLIPLSEMSYTKRVVRSDELVKEGERVTVMIKEIQPDARRISLSLKDAGSDPWALVSQNFPVGATINGKVERRENYGLFIRLDDGIVGLLPKSKALENHEFPYDKLKPGDTVTVQVAEIRQSERKISLAPPGDQSAEDWKAYSSKAQSSTSFGTFGGALGDQLKAAMAKKAKK